MSKGIAILGAGILPKEALLPAFLTVKPALPPLRAVYSPSKESAKDLADAACSILTLPLPPAIYYDGEPGTNLDALLARSDITAVVVVLSITLQPCIIKKALAAGKHVLSQTSVAPDVKQGQDLIATYEKEYLDRPEPLIWRVAEDFEAESGYRQAGNLIRSKEIGDVKSFQAVAVNYIGKDPERIGPNYQAVVGDGVHTFAALRTILPGRLTHLSAVASLQKDYLQPHDNIQAIVSSDNGSNGTVKLTWVSPTSARPPADEFVVTGSNGWLSVNQVSKPGSTRPMLRILVHKQNGKPEGEIIDVPSDGVTEQLAKFFDKIEGRTGLYEIGDPRHALGDVAFIEQAALNSNGNRVDLLNPTSSNVPVSTSGEISTQPNKRRRRNDNK